MSCNRLNGFPGFGTNYLDSSKYSHVASIERLIILNPTLCCRFPLRVYARFAWNQKRPYRFRVANAGLIGSSI